MSRDAKRNKNRLIFVCIVVLIGHWINSYLLFAPGTLHGHGHLGILEVGLGVGFLGLFIKVVLTRATLYWNIYGLQLGLPLRGKTLLRRTRFILGRCE